MPYHALFAIIIVILLSGCAVADLDRRPPVPTLDLNRYLGTWYEIARFDHSFERGMVGVTATYSLRADGRIAVLNQGYRDSLSGKLKQAHAVAKLPNPSYPGLLKVYFVPFFGGEYRILELDTVDYSYALVGSSSMNYLWILGRDSRMDEGVYNRLLEKARELGYDINRLYKVPQK